MSITACILENALAYRLWMAPFAEKKFAPILAHNDLSRVRRVLDVGCGPDTNTHRFAHVDYLGVDINGFFETGSGFCFDLTSFSVLALTTRCTLN